MKWDWSAFWITVAALTATVIVVVPVIDRVKETVVGGGFDNFGEDGEEIPA